MTEPSRDFVPAGGGPCASCAVGSSRRAFLVQFAGGTVAALAAVAGAPGIAAGLGRPLGEDHTAGHRHEERSYPIPDRDGATIDEKNEVILVRWQGFVYAFSLACPHQNTALRWRQDDARFQCPKHKSKYQPDGTFIEGRATRGMDRFTIRRVGQTVVVDLNTLHEYPANPDAWKQAFVALESGAA